jgi:hypothetical protein
VPPLSGLRAYVDRSPRRRCRYFPTGAGSFFATPTDLSATVPICACRYVTIRCPAMVPRPVVLWRDGAWRCEVHPGVDGSARLEVYCGETPIMAEPSVVGQGAEYRAEVLRQRVLRGNLRVPQ